MNYQLHTLPNGLRIIFMPSDSPVVYCGIAVAAGTRHEMAGEEGLAHFCEHLSFKGTQRRTAVQIINALEGVGGELNAFTNKEDTVYYCAILREHLSRAVDVLTDIVFQSTYPQQEVEKEVEVVCDEIESYEDSPAELIFDEIENILFKGHPLGHNILGTASQLRTYGSADAARFTHRHYRPDNCVFFASGNVDFNRLLRLVNKAMEPMAFTDKTGSHSATKGDACQSKNVSYDCRSTPPLETTSNNGGPIVRQRGTHQAHVVLGTRAYAVGDDRRWPLYLINNILGGPGMNARLNLALRERYGLVYTVESSMVSYGDCGAWCVYFGCDSHDVKRCLRLVRRELDRMMQQPLSERQLNAAKQQLRGQLAIAHESREQMTLDVARNYLHLGHVRDLSDVWAHIEKLTSQDLQAVARELFGEERLTTLIYQ